MATSLSLGSSAVTSRPFIAIVPEVGVSSPAMSRRREDLPQPDGPRIARNSPSASVIPIESSARVPLG